MTSTSTSTPRIGMSLEEMHASRAEQRRQRLLEVEQELAMEEVEALKMTEKQRQLLHRPFATVKAEFTDLDGQRWTQRWTQTALRMRQPPQSQPQPQRRVPRQSEALTQTNATFVVLTNADLASFAPEDTIRASSSSTSFPFSSHSNVTHSRLPLPSSTSVHTQLRDSAGTAKPN
ncbi:hypothetical protein GALMADRAFT_148792 [Galerina marginata CBS 339.88]|uniref:Uncharacterized protein n=1 Tax=Galerina marginata (strain CBS 339.88) TaxID=685588 RepID=A0A067S3C8_GALM3|nr:hypothetical protein GALMADRAFT_148792 [Galerina marginata CBS 339.88]